MTRYSAALLLSAFALLGQTAYRISTYAGVPRPATGDILATQLSLNTPRDIVTDTQGNLYISDFGNHRIVKVTAQGRASVLAGTGTQGFTGNGGPASRANITTPRAMALDGTKYLYFAENNIRRVRRVDLATGIITHVAGDGTAGFNGDNRLGTETNFTSELLGLAVDSRGDLLITDTQGHRLRRWSAADGRITTIAGSGTAGLADDNNPSPFQRLNLPSSVAVAPNGDIYFAERNQRIHKIAGGAMTTFVGGPDAARVPILVGPNASLVQAGFSIGIKLNAEGTEFYWSDEDTDTIRRVNLATRAVTLVAGVLGRAGFTGDGGPAAQAQFSNPNGVQPEPDGSLLIADVGNSRVRRVTPNGTVNTVYGAFVPFGGDGGPASAAVFNLPYFLASDSDDNLLMSDWFNQKFRVIDSSGRISSLIGDANTRILSPFSAYRDRGGSVIFSAFNGISVAQPGSNTFLVRTDVRSQSLLYSAKNRAIYAINFRSGNPGTAQVLSFPLDSLIAGGFVTPTVVVGAFQGAGGDGGPLTGNVLAGPNSIAFDADENLYILDVRNANIRAVKNGVLSTIVSNPALAGAGGLAIDQTTGGIWFTVGHQVVRVDARGVTTHLLGSLDGEAGFTEGPGSDGVLARFDTPYSVAIRRDGSVYVADGNNHVIRKLTPVRITRMESVPGTATGTVSVRLIGEDQEVISGYPVRFTASGGVTLAVGTVYTDSSGVATARTTGTDGTVTATLEGLPAVTQTLGVAANLPEVSAAISAGAFGGLGRIAPGGWMEIYGSNLAKETLQWTGDDFRAGVAPTALGGVLVTVDGKPAFVQLVSPGQINCVAPDGLPAGQVTVTVTNELGTSAAFRVTAAARAPGLLSPPAFLVGGKQYAAALFPDGSFVGPEGLIPGVNFRPAAAGDRILLYGVGFGATTPAVAAGRIVTQTALLPNVQVRIGGVPATVEFAGLAGNLVGLYQLNVVVPPGVSGDAPLAVTVSGVAAQALVIGLR